MGLLDDLLGGVLGKTDPQGNAPQGGGSPGSAVPGGLSKPLMLALLALLASGVLNRRGAADAPGAPQPAPSPAPSSTASDNPLGDLLGGLLGGSKGPQGSNPLGDLLGGLLGGGGAGGARRAAAPGSTGNPLGDMLGSMLGGNGSSSGGALAGGLLGGLGSVLGQLQQSGQRDAINSWIGGGQNRQISAGELQVAFSPEVIRDLSARTGLSPDEVLAQISEGLPDLVDQLTPEGHLPSVSGDPSDPSLRELSQLSEKLR